MTKGLDAVPVLGGFARTLRAAGVPATTDRLQRLVEALEQLDASRREHVYWAGRLTLCGTHDDLEPYDRVFAAYFGGDRPVVGRRPAARTVVLPAADVGDPVAGEDARAESPPVAVSASNVEVLREKDFSALSATEREQLNRLLSALRLPGDHRRSRRWQPASSGAVDRARTVRAMLRSGGEPSVLRYRAHRSRPRRVVLLTDVSGSMSPYADALLRFAHAAARRSGPAPRTEVFTIGTRLTRVSRELSHRDTDTAMAAVAAAVPDWSGGTRLGELLKAFLDRWGQRGTARGAVVVILSDGWEQGDPGLLAEQMARLSRLAHRIVWANPRKGRPGYEPLVAGMAAALPYVDDFVAGHSLAALQRLARVVAGAERSASHA